MSPQVRTSTKGTFSKECNLALTSLHCLRFPLQSGANIPFHIFYIVHLKYWVCVPPHLGMVIPLWCS